MEINISRITNNWVIRPQSIITLSHNKEMGEPLCHGVVNFHVGSNSKYIPCIDSLVHKSGVFCPLDEYSPTPKRYRYQLFIEDGHLHLNKIDLKKFPTPKGKQEIITAAVALCSTYVNPLTPLAFESVDNYPSHIIGALYGNYKFFINWADEFIKEYINEQSS